MLPLQRNLRSLKQSIVQATSCSFFLRYSTLAPYRALCAATSTLTGLTQSGSHDRSVEDAVNYIQSVFAMYKAASGLDRFHGRMAELGPGDSCGVGLMFLAHGCETADLADRFFSNRDMAHQCASNRALVDRFPQLTSLLRDDSYSELSFANLKRYYGESAAAENFFRSHGKYDFIVSCAVLEHVYDPLSALSATIAALNHGGILLHQIDCRDHGQFSAHFHELKFLEIPAPLYSPLKWKGGPNRVRLSSYLEVLRRQKMDYSVYVNSLANGPQEFAPNTTFDQIDAETLEKSRKYVSEIRPRLSSAFRNLSDEDLMITRFLIAAKHST
jgi:SAM-dependent methyltransferase